MGFVSPVAESAMPYRTVCHLADLCEAGSTVAVAWALPPSTVASADPRCCDAQGQSSPASLG